MADESWDNDGPTETNAMSQSESAPQTTARLGFGRGRPNAQSTASQEPKTTSTWNSSGSSETFSRFSNNDENRNPSSGGFNSFRGRTFENSRGGGGDRGGRGGRGGFGNGSGSFGSGNSGDSRACYNCNQSGHMSRDCPEPSKNNRGGGGGGFNSRGGGSGRGGFNSGSNGDRGGGFQSFGNRNDSSETSGFRSAGGQDNNYDNKSNTNTWRPKQNPDSSSSFSGGTGGFSNSQGGFRGGNRGDNDRDDFKSMGNRSNNQFRPSNDDRKPRDGGEPGGFGDSNRKRDVSDDVFDQPSARGGDRPTERYIPPPPPTKEDDIFGKALEKGENFDKYHKVKVKCSPEGRIKPLDIYEEGDFTSQVLSNIRRAHFDEPTPVQRYTIPGIQQQEDIMACAQTGSGKTAAFLLPIISNLLKYHKDELSEKPTTPSPLCLILSPTRELALQTEREARKFAFQTPIIPCSVIGGHDMYTVSDRLRDGCHILSATTGRLKDMVDKGRVSLKKVRYFVLDEADRMLDTGFEPDIRKLEETGLPHKDDRVTSMFSATFPETVQKMAIHFLRKDYIFLTVGSPGGANEDISQTIEEVPASKKKDRLFQLLKENLKDQRCLIFVETKRSADYIGTLLSQTVSMSTTMHGDRTQRQRVEAVQQFTDGKCPVLVATSVAARGLDFPLIGYVVNYDLPDSSDFYIHRIGRTGRAGHLGKSISFFDPERDSDRRIAPELVTKLSEAGQEVPDFLKRYTDAGSSGYNSSGSMGRNMDMRAQTTGFGSRSQASGASGGTASAGAAQQEMWD